MFGPDKCINGGQHPAGGCEAPPTPPAIVLPITGPLLFAQCPSAYRFSCNPTSTDQKVFVLCRMCVHPVFMVYPPPPRRYFCNALAMNGAQRRRYYCNALPASHTLVSHHPWPCVTSTLLVVVSTSQPGVLVMTAYRALIRPSGEDAMGRSCILVPPPPPGRGMPAAVRMPAVVRMPACHSRRFKGERPIGAATG